MVVGEFSVQCDVAVIGAGPAGLAAARRAHALGQRTVLVAHPHAECPWSAAHPALREGLEALGVEVIDGTARFDGGRDLSVLGGVATPRLRFRRAILATGRRPELPAELVGLAPRSDATGGTDADADPTLPHLCTPWQLGPILALAPFDDADDGDDDAPHACVTGDGAEHLSAADWLTTLGWRVTLVLPGDRPLPHAPDGIRDAAAALLAEDPDLTVVRGAVIAGAVRVDDAAGAHWRVELAGAAGAAADLPALDPVQLVVAGRLGPAELDGLGLESTGVAVDEGGFVRCGDDGRTDDPRILAAGDATGPDVTMDLAQHQGRLAAETAAGRPERAAAAPEVPARFALTTPELAWCGRDVAEDPDALALHVARAVPDGLDAAALVVERATGLVVGGWLVGFGADSAIAELALACEMGAVAEDLASVARDGALVGVLLAEAADAAREDAP